MKQHLRICIFILILHSLLWSQSSAPRSPRNASYTIDVTLDVQKKQISGKETIIWKNITSKPAKEIYFHLYMNAFKNNYSTFIKEAGGKAKLLEKKNQWGWVKINHISDYRGIDLTGNLYFVQPDDSNSYDRTVALLKLKRPVLPGASITLNLNFTTQFPPIYARTGFYKNFFLAGQWFPKVGVFEKNGKWNCHQFHRNSEFFSDYGKYNVSITLPSNFKIEATGIKTDVKQIDSSKKVTFYAEDVHDFAWTAWPHFLKKEITYKGIRISLIYEKDHESSVERSFTAIRHDLDFFEEWAGKYPYSHITILHPPTGAFRASGMEYPQFITGGTIWNIPKGLRFVEMVVVHEFGHQFWYGIVGSNEFEEAWLDEGINSYFESKIMDKYYGQETSLIDFAGIKIGEISNARSAYIGKARLDRILRPSWTYIGGGYSLFSYQKSVLMLRTLENIIGTDNMKKIFRTYFDRWKFKHPHSDDFIKIVNEVTGKDYNFYFDQFLKNSLELDYKVESAFCHKVRKPKGIFSDSAKTELNSKKNLFRSVVKIYRKGEAVLPIDVLIVFDSGDSLKFVWDGKDRWKKYTFIRPDKILSAAVDPGGKLLLDSNHTNNSKTAEIKNRPILYFTSNLISFYQAIFHIITLII